MHVDDLFFFFVGAHQALQAAHQALQAAHQALQAARSAKATFQEKPTAKCIFITFFFGGGAHQALQDALFGAHQAQGSPGQSDWQFIS